MRFLNLVPTSALLIGCVTTASAVALDGPWYTGSNNGTPTLSDPNSDAFTFGSDASSSVSAQSGLLWTYFNDATLAEDGDFVTVSFNVTFNDAPAASSFSGFRLGLFDDNGSRLESNLSGTNGDTAFEPSRGYFVEWSLDDGAGLTQLVLRNGSHTTPVGSTGASDFGAAGPGGDALAADVPYAVSFTITQASGTEYNISTSFNGNSFSRNTSTLTASTYNSFFLLNTPGWEIDSMDFDSFAVTTNTIPEPSTYSLILGGCLMGLLVIRLRNHKTNGN